MLIDLSFKFQYQMAVQLMEELTKSMYCQKKKFYGNNNNKNPLELEAYISQMTMQLPKRKDWVRISSKKNRLFSFLTYLLDPGSCQFFFVEEANRYVVMVHASFSLLIRPEGWVVSY